LKVPQDFKSCGTFQILRNFSNPAELFKSCGTFEILQNFLTEKKVKVHFDKKLILRGFSLLSFKPLWISFSFKTLSLLYWISKQNIGRIS
jgi:hypothetical protein